MNDTYKSWSIFQSPEKGTDKYTQPSTGSADLGKIIPTPRKVIDTEEKAEQTYSSALV